MKLIKKINNYKNKKQNNFLFELNLLKSIFFVFKLNTV